MFKLPFDIPESSQKIALCDPVLLMGSCFSDEMGSRLVDAKFKVVSNPFGTIYNPHSIFKLLSDDVDDSHVIESQEVFFHWDTHGSLSGQTSGELLEQLQMKREVTQHFLKQSKFLIITLGTSIVYETADQHIVANCHKVPSQAFTKRFLTKGEILDCFNRLKQHLDTINPDLDLIFTVSPARHIRDGLVENNRSKAILIDAIHMIVESFDAVSYFPSYEILMDELRDYRFYAEDMIHPSKQSSDYIWQAFVQCYFDDETQAFVNEWNKIQASIRHRPLHPSSSKHQTFLKKTLSKLEALNEKADLHVEINEVKNQII